MIDPSTGEVVRTVTSDRLVTGISWIGDDLWQAGVTDEETSSDGDAELRRIDPKTGEILEGLEVAANVSGLAGDGSQFFCGDCSQSYLRVVDKP